MKIGTFSHLSKHSWTLLFCIYLISQGELGAAFAGVPQSPGVTIEESLKYDTDLIFQGTFKRVVSIKKELNDQLWDANATISSKELKFRTEEVHATSDTSFAEIVNVRLLFVHSKLKNTKSFKCKYESIYIKSSTFSNDELAAYHKELIGKTVVLRLSQEMRYGINSTKFPQPFFQVAGGRFNWADGQPLISTENPELEGLAMRLGYLAHPAIECIN